MFGLILSTWLYTRTVQHQLGFDTCSMKCICIFTARLSLLLLFYALSTYMYAHRVYLFYLLEAL